MFACTACTRRCLRAVVSDALDARPSLPTTPHVKVGLVTTLGQNGAETQRWQEPFRQSFMEDTKLPAGNAKDWEPRDTRYQDPARLALQKELRFLKDPLKLAEHTVRLLHRGETEKAYELVKLSSKSLACTVSWNHLMDYEMAKGSAANAMRM